MLIAEPSLCLDLVLDDGDLHPDSIRGQLPARAQIVHAAVVEYASAWWEQEVRRVIEKNPVRALENAHRFAQLKDELRELQRNASTVAEKYFESALSADSIDDRVAAILRGPRRDPDGNLIEPLDLRFWEEPLRHVLGAVGPLLGRAGLTNTSAISLDPTAAIDSNGRYRYELVMSEELIAATASFDAMLQDLAVALTGIEKLKQEKMRQHALAIWEQT